MRSPDRSVWINGNPAGTQNVTGPAGLALCPEDINWPEEGWREIRKSPCQPGGKFVPGVARHDGYKPQVTQQEDSERNPERNRMDATELESIVHRTRREEYPHHESYQESFVAQKKRNALQAA